MRSKSDSRLVAIFAAVLLCGLGAAIPAEAASLPGLAGGELRDQDFEGGKLIAVVWTSWSPHCRDLGPRVNALLERWGDDARVVTINLSESVPEVTAFRDAQGLRAEVFLDRDGSFSKKHAVTRLPGLLVFAGGPKPAYNGPLPRDAESVIASALTR